MDLDLFESLIHQLKPLTEQVCFHLMGEPLLHPKLKEMILLCDRAELPIHFVSNGVLLTEARAELLLHPRIRQVNFSLHSFADNFPKQNPRPYLEKIFAFTERAFLERPDLYLNYRLWNLQDTSVKNASQNNLEILTALEEKFNFSFAKIPAHDLRTQKSVKIKNRLYLHFDSAFVWPNLDLPVLGSKGTCYGLSGHFGILADGTVVPCCLDKEGIIPLGNANQTPLTEILQQERARKILKGFQERQLVEELCKRCDYIKRFS